MNRKLVFIRGFLLLCLVICCLPLASLAADKVVVIPLFGHGKPLKNVVTVAKSGGKFTDPVAAVNSITDASANNPYLVVIGPGVYTLTQTLVMKPWVDVMGSGENITTLKGSISENLMWNSAIIRFGNDAVLSDLTIENNGGNKYSIGIFFEHSPFVKTSKIWKVYVNATGGIYNTAIMIYYSSATITEVNASCQGGSKNDAIAILHSSATINRVHALASGDSSLENNGVVNGYSDSELNDVDIFASGGTNNTGLYNYYTTIHMTQVHAIGRGRQNSYGMRNVMGDCLLNIQRSTISGGTNAVYDDNPDSGKIFFSQSTISGGINTTGSTTITCVACDDGSGHALNGACQ